MATDPTFDFEPEHALSATEDALENLRLYGYRPLDDEPDPRPAPGATEITAAVTDIFDALVSTLADTALEPDLPQLLSSTPASPARSSRIFSRTRRATATA